MNKNKFAITPPMGWNSYDYYDTTVNEEQVKKNVFYIFHIYRSDPCDNCSFSELEKLTGRTSRSGTFGKPDKQYKNTYEGN